MTRNFVIYPYQLGSRDSSVGIGTDCLLGGQCLIPVGGKIFISSGGSTPALGPIQPSIQWVKGGLFHGVKRPGLEAGHSPPSSVEVKNGGLFLQSHICLHGVVLM
jgi:hypothetical protein